MASLRTLLNQRSAQTDVDFREGQVYSFAPNFNTANAFCWRSLGRAGTAIIEVWGAGGGGGGGQCCGMGIPGNSGAYSRATVTMDTNGFICGSVGGSLASSSCNGCRGLCAFVGVAPAGTLNRCIISQGGFGGFWMCQTGVSQFCCFAANGFCVTPYSSIPGLSTVGCGFVCNIGSTTLGQGAKVEACACGGDINIPGGISCTDMCNCTPQVNLVRSRHYHSFPAGLIGCQPGHALACYCSTRATTVAGGSRGEAAFELSFSRLKGGQAVASRHFLYCCGVPVDCGCFPYQCIASNGVVGAGYGSQAAVDGGITNTGCGSRGGPGLVKITFIE